MSRRDCTDVVETLSSPSPSYRCQGDEGHGGVHWADLEDGRVLSWLADDGARGFDYMAANEKPAAPMSTDEAPEAFVTVQQYRQALWDIFAVLGFDTDGDPTPAAVGGDLGALVLAAATEFRADCDAQPAPQQDGAEGASSSYKMTDPYAQPADVTR